MADRSQPAGTAPSARPRFGLRTAAWIGCLGLAALSAWLWGQIPEIDESPLFRIVLFAALGLLVFPLTFLFPDFDRRRSTLLLLGAAVLLRLLLLPAPVSDDVNRYLWEGRLTLAGENPFAAVADDPVREPFHDDYWEAMNHRDRPTAYPPGIQWVLAAAVAIDYHPWTMKALALAGDLATLALLLVLLARERGPVRWAVIYALNPVVLVSFAAEAHFDSLMVAPLLGMLLAHRQNRPALAWLMLGLAVQAKLVCIVLAPLLLHRRHLVAPLAFVAALLIPSIPFLGEVDAWWRGVTTFAGGGLFNGPLASLITAAGIPVDTARTLILVAFGISAAAITIARWRGLPLIDACILMLGSLLLCSPIVHFWYVAWVLPFAVLRPSFGWAVASTTMAGYFLVWWTQQSQGWWGFSPVVATLLWTPPLLAFLLQNRGVAYRLRRIFRSRPTPSLPASIDVVIPTLNAGPALRPLIAELRSALPASAEVIVSDGGSSDDSLREIDAEVLSGPSGRGRQIAAGIDASKADWVVLVHADATPTNDWLGTLQQAIRTHPRTSMFVFGQRFDRKSGATLLIEALNEMRVVFGGVAFGDQTMAIRRSALDELGGFPAQPLMEDVEISMRLRKAGKIHYLAKEWQVSAEKWRHAAGRRIFTIVRLVATYQFARLRGPAAAEACAERLYGEYYGSRS